MLFPMFINYRCKLYFSWKPKKVVNQIGQYEITKRIWKSSDGVSYNIAILYDMECLSFTHTAYSASVTLN